MTAHTPGPWRWRHKYGSLHRIGEYPHTFSAAVLSPFYEYETGVDTQVSNADATLIAASPELLEALRGTTAALVAAISLLERGGKKAAPSDKMFFQMLKDYTKAAEAGRVAILRATIIEGG